MDDDWYNEYYLFDAGRASTSVAHGMQAGRFRHLSDDDKHDLLTVMARISERSFRRWFHQGAVGYTAPNLLSSQSRNGAP